MVLREEGIVLMKRTVIAGALLLLGVAITLAQQSRLVRREWPRAGAGDRVEPRH